MCYKMMKSVDLYKKKASGDIYLIHQRLFYKHAINLMTYITQKLRLYHYQYYYPV